MDGHWREVLEQLGVRADAVPDGYALHKKTVRVDDAGKPINYADHYLHAFVSLRELEQVEGDGEMQKLLDSLEWK